MVRQDLQQVAGQLRESAVITYIPTVAKIPVEIREILYIKDTDFSALRREFEEFCKKWD